MEVTSALLVAMMFIVLLTIGIGKYATKYAGLISEAVNDKEIIEIRNSVLTEPLAALLTIPFAFIGPGLWNLSWLSVLFFGWFLKKRKK